MEVTGRGAGVVGAPGRKNVGNETEENWQQLRELATGQRGVQGLSCRLRTPIYRLKLCPPRGPARSRSRGHTVYEGVSRFPSSLSLPRSLTLHHGGGGASIHPNSDSLDFPTFAVIFIYLNGGLSSLAVM